MSDNVRLTRTGERLLKEFQRLNDIIVNQRYLESDDPEFEYKVFVGDANRFQTMAKQYILDASEFVDSSAIYLKSTQHKYQNDEEVDSLAMRDFYSYGITVREIVAELRVLTRGFPQTKRKYNHKFYYIVDERIIYRDSIEMEVVPTDMKSTTLCEVAFENRGKEVDATDIENQRVENCNGVVDDEDEPYEWVRKACLALNKKTKKKFGIDYNLFEKRPGQKIRLNPKAG